MLKKLSRPVLTSLLVVFALSTSCDRKPVQPKEKEQQTTVSAEEKQQPINEKDLLLSETLGNFIGQTLKNPTSGVVVNVESLITGIRNGFKGLPAPLSEEEYEKIILLKEEEDFERRAAENLKAANEFMQGNTGESIIVLIPGQIHYEILHRGKELPTVTESSTPSIHYKGMLLDGTIFGSTEKTGPVNISLNSMIPGFKKGIVGMSEGEKRRLYIHPEMAYGMKGELPPNSLLIFEVDVVDADLGNQEEDYEIVEDRSYLDEDNQEDQLDQELGYIESQIEEQVALNPSEPQAEDLESVAATLSEAQVEDIEAVVVNSLDGATCQVAAPVEAIVNIAPQEELMSTLPVE